MSDQKVLNLALLNLEKSAALRTGARKYQVKSIVSAEPSMTSNESMVAGSNLELMSGRTFPQTLRVGTADELLKSESNQLRNLRLREQHPLSHFDSLYSELGEWNWEKSSIRENSVLVAQRHSSSRTTGVYGSTELSLQSPSYAASSLSNDPSLIERPPSVVGNEARIKVRRGTFDHRRASSLSNFGSLASLGRAKYGPRTPGDAIVALRTSLLASSTNAKGNTTTATPLFSLTESLYPTYHDDVVPTNVTRSRHMRLLQMGDELVNQAIRHMDRINASN